MARPERAAGFTLIETVVALLIVSLGMTAVFMQLNSFATNAVRMQEKTLASWIGANIVTEISLQPAWPELGDEERDIEYASREWHVTIRISETEVDELRRADVDVALGERPGRIIDTVSGLIEPPAPEGFPPVRWRTAESGPRG